jgi:putative ABC transport system permease protein
MMLGDTTGLALRNLREAVLRTVLTSLGVAIGIASLVGMVSFGVALQDQVLGSLLRSGIFDSITVTAQPRGGGGRGRGGPGQRMLRDAIAAAQQGPRVRLDDDAVTRLAAIAGVKEVYPDIRVPVEVTYGEFSEFSMASGVALSAKGQGVFQSINHGTFFPNDTDDTCITSLDFARRVTGDRPESLIGKTLTLGFVSSSGGAPMPTPVPLPGGLTVQRSERTFRVVGLIERPQGGMVGLFSSIMIPLAKARDMGAADVSSPQAILRHLTEKPEYTTITVKVRRAGDTEEVEKTIKELGFNAFSIADALQNQKRAFILLDLLLGLVGSIALTVASLGIVNTMVMSILERTREIGIMKAIGGSDQDVRWIFLVEAALIGLLGGVFGVLLGWGVGRVINRVANYYLANQGVPAANLFLIPWWLVAGAIGFALVVSLIAGSFPAMRAARLDPIQALRHD